MQTLHDFILQRFKELDALELPLQEQLKAIATERAQLRRAADGAGILFIPREQPLMELTRRTIPERTIKEAVIEVLRDKPGGMTALEILAAINLRFSTDYPRTSLSPQLSRLKTDQILEREGIVWRLTEVGKNKSPTEEAGLL